MIKDYEIPMPRWELSDPFGRAAIKGLRYDLKKALCERDGYRVELEETLNCQGRAVDRLSQSLSAEQARATELDRRLQMSEEARKSLGTKLAAANERASKIENEISYYKAKLELLEGDFNELSKEHERVIRGLTDKDAVICADDEKEVSE